MAEDANTTTDDNTNEPENLNQQSDEQVQADQEALNSSETVTTTVTNEASAIPVVEKQGEVVVDKDATADVVGGNQTDDEQVQTDNIAQAKADALTNHAAHVAEQPASTPAETASE